jgi:hypothetical protein
MLVSSLLKILLCRELLQQRQLSTESKLLNFVTVKVDTVFQMDFIFHEQHKANSINTSILNVY